MRLENFPASDMPLVDGLDMGTTFPSVTEAAAAESVNSGNHVMLTEEEFHARAQSMGFLEEEYRAIWNAMKDDLAHQRDYNGAGNQLRLACPAVGQMYEMLPQDASSSNDPLAGAATVDHLSCAGTSGMPGHSHTATCHAWGLHE